MDEWINSGFGTGGPVPGPEMGTQQQPGLSRKSMRSVFSRFALVYLLCVVVFNVLGYIPGLPESSWFLALLNDLLEDVWAYGPFFLFFGLLLRRYPMTKLSDLPATCSRPKVLQVIAVFLFAAGVSYFFGLAATYAFKFLGVAVGSSGSSGTNSVAYLLVSILDAAIMVPILEEYIFRRMLQDRLMFLGSGTAILMTSLFFSIAHLNHPTRVVNTFFVGMILGCVHMKTGKMRWNILLHMGINALSFAIGYMGALIGVLFIFGTIIFAVIYVIVRRPWRGIVVRGSGVPAREKFTACVTSVPFWITIVLLVVIAIVQNL